MKIVSLEPYITELILFFGLGKQLVGISHECIVPEELSHIARVTGAKGGSAGKAVYYNPKLKHAEVYSEILAEVKPNIIVAAVYPDSLKTGVLDEEVQEISLALNAACKINCRLFSYFPRAIREIYSQSDELAKILKVNVSVHDFSKRLKAGLMNWADNFYDRMKNKKVTFISSLTPLRLAGFWLPDMIQMVSAVSQAKAPEFEDIPVKWKEIIDFKPDVIVYAPKGQSLKDSLAAFKIMEKYPEWENIPAVKRGEVVFADGLEHFYTPGPKIIDSFGILVSAVAGFESGYITPKDSFYRLRWLELQRHRI